MPRKSNKRLHILHSNGFGFRDASANALEILNERPARGEIDEEEYKQKKALLMKR